MSTLTFQTAKAVNYKAVIVLSICAYLLGALWYSPVLFEQAWMDAQGYDRTQVDAILDDLAPFGFIGSFLAYLATCFVTAMLCLATCTESIRSGVKLGLALWVGYAASLGLMTNLFSSTALVVWAIDSAFQLVFLVGIGAILGIWQKNSI